MWKNKRGIRQIALLLPLPLIVAGAISAGVIGATAWNLSQESKIEKERAEAAEQSECGAPETWQVPPLIVVEAWDADNENAPS